MVRLNPDAAQVAPVRAAVDGGGEDADEGAVDGGGEDADEGMETEGAAAE